MTDLHVILLKGKSLLFELLAKANIVNKIKWLSGDHGAELCFKLMTMKEPFPSLDLLPGLFREYTGIKAVYLFGSAATGNLRSDSDLNIWMLTEDWSMMSCKTISLI